MEEWIATERRAFAKAKKTLQEDAQRFAILFSRLPALANHATNLGGIVSSHPPSAELGMAGSPTLAKMDSPRARAIRGLHVVADTQPMSSDLSAHFTPKGDSHQIQPRKLHSQPRATSKDLRWVRSLPEITKLPRLQMYCTRCPYTLDQDIPLEQIVVHNEARLISNGRSRRLYIIDGRYFLKLMRPDVDVDTIAANMIRARAVVPVPAVYASGRGFNYSYILMEFVKGTQLRWLMNRYPDRDFSEVKPQVEEAVRRLANIDLAHNDFYSHNVLVDRHLNIVSIVDWDTSSRLDECDEYQIRAVHGAADHEWDSAFRRYYHPAVLEQGDFRYQYRDIMTARTLRIERMS